MKLQSVGAYQTKTHLADLLRRVQMGQGFTITQRGAPVADLLPAGAGVRRSGMAAAARMQAFMQAAPPPRKNAKADIKDEVKALIEAGRD